MSDIVEDLAHYLQHRWKGWTKSDSESCYRFWAEEYGQEIADKIKAKVEGGK